MPLRLPSSSLYTTQLRNAWSSPTSIAPFPRTFSPRPLFPKNSVRPAHQSGPRRTQYNRFENSWRTSPKFRYGVGASVVGFGAFYYYNIEPVPISGRRRFNFVSQAQEEAIAQSAYEAILKQYGRQVLPPNHPHSRMVNKVLQRLIPAAGLEGQNWEVKVINDPEQKNAFVLPGGKVFVFSGILPICAGEDGLAAVLGHEIAHNVARHNGERLSHQIYLLPITVLLAYVLDISGGLSQFVLDLVLNRPGSRKMESEADYIGLLMMAKACYEPSAVVGLWERMAKAEQYAPPQFLSTHPTSKNRGTVIQEWLPQAQQQRAQSDCGSLGTYAHDFTMAFRKRNDDFW